MAIFDFIFDLSVLHFSLVFAFGGLVLMIIGGALIHEHKVWSKAARKVRGVIKSMRKCVRNDEDKSIVYYPIVEYTGPDGKSIEAESDIGSSEYINHIPGKTIEVYINPASPHRFRLRDGVSHAAGYVVISIGMIIFFLSVRSMEFSLMTLAVSVLFLAWGYVKIRKKINSLTIWTDPYQFAVKAKEEMFRGDTQVSIMNKEEVLRIVKKQDKDFMRFFPISLILVLCFFAFGLYCVLAQIGVFQENPLAEAGIFSPIIAWGVFGFGCLMVIGIFKKLGEVRIRQTRFLGERYVAPLAFVAQGGIVASFTNI